MLVYQKYYYGHGYEGKFKRRENSFMHNTCTCIALHSIINRALKDCNPVVHAGQVNFLVMHATFHARLSGDQGIRQVVWQPKLIIKGA